MATSYLGLLAGRITEVLAGLTGGAADANKIPALDGSGRLPLGMMPTGIGPDSNTLPAGETLFAGAWVYITSTGTVKLATASGSGTHARGYVLVGAANNANAQVFFDDNNTAVTGLTIGDQWLSATPGQCTNTPPTGVGVISQLVGVATSASNVHANIQQPVILAQ